MDLKELAISMDTVEMVFDHPITGVPMDGEDDIRFSILPPQHPSVVEIDKRFRNKLLKSAKKSLGSAEDFDNQTIEVLVACVAGWKNVMLDGKPLEHSTANVRKLLSDPELAWVKDQVQGFVNELQNFIKKA